MAFFIFFYARSRISKGNIEGLYAVSVYFTDKKEQNKAKDKYTEIRRSNEEAQKETIKLRSFPFRSFSVEKVSWLWVGGSVG